MEIENTVTDSLKKYPFLTHATYVDVDYLGIIGNSDPQITSMYIFGLLPTDELKKTFIELGEEWWWETNKQLPINLALKQRWSVFKPYMRTFITKDLVIHSGPCTSIDEISSKRIKRRQIQLVRKDQ